MAPKGRAALTKRQKLRPDLKGDDIIWLGLKASEFNIHRLATFLAFCEHKVEVEPYVDQLADFIPVDGELPAMEIDYNVVRKDIVALLMQYNDAGRVADAKRILGGVPLVKRTDAELLPIWEALKLEAPGTNA